MKRFEATYKDDSRNEHMTLGGENHATAVVFDIIADSEDRALQLIDGKGEDSSAFELDEVSGIKDQRGRFFSERIKDCRL